MSQESSEELQWQAMLGEQRCEEERVRQEELVKQQELAKGNHLICYWYSLFALCGLFEVLACLIE